MRVAIHQPNFIPWYPYFYKMAMADKFVILRFVQFEKNGYQNRCRVFDRWITKPVEGWTSLIADKRYCDNTSLVCLNMKWIRTLKETLQIDTELIEEPLYFLEKKYPNKTQRLIDIIKDVGGDTYITNPDAKDKYLDEDLMRSQGIEIEYCKVPKHLQKHTFEVLAELGLQGAINNLPKRINKCEMQIV